MSDPLSSIANVVEQLAPTVASLLGGPLAGTGVMVLEKALGLDPKGDAQAVAAQFANLTPDQIAAIKKADNDFAIQLKELEIEPTKLAYQDVQNARQRETAVKDSTPKVLAYLLTLGFFGLLGALLRWSPPQGSAQVLYIMIGGLGTAWTTMVAYYYGSSRTSDDHSSLLSNLMTAIPGTQPQLPWLKKAPPAGK